MIAFDGIFTSAGLKMKFKLSNFGNSTPPASKYGLGSSRPTEKAEVPGFAVGLENFRVGLEIWRWTWPKSNWT